MDCEPIFTSFLAQTLRLCDEKMIIMTSLEKMADEESSGDEYEWDPPNNKVNSQSSTTSVSDLL